jgi:hypothetical protein
VLRCDAPVIIGKPVRPDERARQGPTCNDHVLTVRRFPGDGDVAATVSKFES